MVDEAAQLGCTLLQIADSPELESFDGAQRHRLRSYASGRGVRLQVGTSGLTEPRMRDQLQAAQDLGADVVRVVLDGAEGHPTVSESVAVLRRLAPDYEAAGVMIGIENHFMTPSEDLATIVEGTASTAVGVCLDTANSIMIGEWPLTTVKMLARYCVNMHFKDYAILPDRNGVGGHIVGRTLGEGWLDIPSVLDSAAPADRRLAGRLGVIIEQWLPLAGSEAETISAERTGQAANVAAARRILAAYPQPSL
ncbi:sugar phosphate isomerase/epimerase family protein [Phytoactinopolyspora endophytica]|uniref:sugar phosphate isomerase/epimerase family protein n=1 Tax=Phytoactinopolyspora endophytica TaxID=1642495 RepID=UPI001F0D83AC|nr:sugar phosphate isomerase/epimerase family protein [Phytoactinopolyspora endophytica]